MDSHQQEAPTFEADTTRADRFPMEWATRGCALSHPKEFTRLQTKLATCEDPT